MPEAPCQRVALVGVSPLADRTTINRNVTSEYLSLSSNIMANFTPTSVILSPIRCPRLFSLSSIPDTVPRKLLLTICIALCTYSIPSGISIVPLLVSIVLASLRTRFDSASTDALRLRDLGA